MSCYWDPEEVLEIRGKARSGEIQCSGTNRNTTGPRFGERCGYEKWRNDQDNKEVQELLPVLSRRTVSSITLADLVALAELCLCRDNHAGQKHDLAGQWQRLLDNVEPVGETIHQPDNEPMSTATDTRQPRWSGFPVPPSTQLEINSRNPLTTSIGSIAAPGPRATRQQLRVVKTQEQTGMLNTMADLQLENEGLRAAEARLQAMAKDRSRVKERSDKEYKQMQQAISQLSSEKGHLDTLLQVAVQGRAEAEAKAKRRKQELSDKNGLIVDLRETIATQNVSLTSARAVCVAKDEDIKTLQQQLASVRSGLEQLGSELRGVKSQSELYRERMLATLQATERERDEARADLQEAMRTLSRLKLEQRLEGREMVTIPPPNGDRQSWLRRLGRWMTGRTSHVNSARPY
ncbi:hypothetical protein QBC34DRAFT_419372 [Podospora aff. communis PSN243]|uniref:Uncharacterized protein n=1 Tax=Podospora aff. communis PSN243 TaxID=3040156 RepID=A0AAV9FVA3_9PEZI|nr:hypothetical protein QBC34DRAFT_419372 [Podospora aff. communis PSN243]